MEFMSICAQHEGCNNCPAINGQVMNIGNLNIVCETGRNKEKVK